MIRKEAGQTIMEVLVALSVALIVLSAITAIVLGSLNSATSSKSLGAATEYAQQGIELALGRGNFSVNDTYCMRATNPWGLSGACPSNLTDTYKRELTVSSTCPNSTKMKVTVTVSWTDSKCTTQTRCHSVPVATCI